MKKMFVMAAAAAVMCGCAKKSDNPLFNEFSAPFGIAPFSEITIEHYREGMLKGMEEQKAEIEAIVNNTDEPTFENTIAAMDRSGELMRKVRGTFSPLSSSNSTDEMRALEKELSPMFSSHSDDIYMNVDLFARVKAVYEKRESLGLDAEQQKVLENIAKLSGKTCIISTHRPSVLALCDHVYRIHNAKLERLSQEDLKTLHYTS
mgnify:CR=1 FL=1